MFLTTLNKIHECSPCVSGWKTLLQYLGKTKADNEPLSFLTILKSNEFDDALWCARSAPEYDKEWRLFAVWCARQVQYLISDERSFITLDVTKRFAHGEVTHGELDAVWDSAWDSARDSARVASDAAWAAAWGAADAARVAASDAAWGAAWGAARVAQKEQFIKIITGINHE